MNHSNFHRIAVTFDADTHTFAGNDRDASISIVADENVDMHLLSDSRGSKALLGINSNITIVRARLISAGAPGLDVAGRAAGVVNLHFKGNTSGTSATVTLTFTKWNEWETMGVTTGTGGCVGSSASMVVEAGSSFGLDDYNIDSAYIGESTYPIIELEVDSSGIIPTT